MRRGSISSELIMCGGGARSILLLPLVDRLLETIDVCIWRMSVVVTVGMFVLHYLHLVKAGRGCNRRPYGRGTLQSRSHVLP